MRSNDLQLELINWTVRNARHDDHRRYLGLSHIGDCDRIIYDQFLFGTPTGIAGKLKYELCYDLEEVIVKRLTALGLFQPGVVIELYDGLVRGRTDGEVAGDLLEIKTLELEKWLPVPPHLPNKIFYQVQAYMHYAEYQQAHIVYIARDTGAIRVIGVRRKPDIGQRIENKLLHLVEAIQLRQPPACSCGHCKEPTP